MSSYYVLTPPDVRDPDMETLFIRDGFSWIGFLLPLPWLLFRRLWLIAGLAVVLYLAAALGAEYYNLIALPTAYSVVLGLWVGLEGGHVRARMLERQGWRLDAVVSAETLTDAEVLYFAESMEANPPTPPGASLTRPADAGPQARTAGLLALGLIDADRARR